MTKDLTEQWKNGELPEGWYYIEVNEPFKEIYKTLSYYSFSTFDIDIDGNYILEVLAEVPDYLEWKNYVNGYCEEHEANNRLIEENAKLKETIKRTKANGNYPSRVSAYKSRIATLCEENQKLKELLEQASYYLIGYRNNDTLPERAFYEEEVSEFLEKIDEVLK